MTQTIYTKSDSVKEICLKAFPNYSGKQFRMEITENPIGLESYWSGGTKSYFKVIRLSDNKIVSIPENGNGFTPDIDNTVFPCNGFVVIEHSMFCGKDMGLILHIHPENVNPDMLPGKVELTIPEMIVLCATGYKSSYAGISNYRFHESHNVTGISKSDYESAKQSLIDRKLLNKRGAITDSGRNARGNSDLWKFRNYYRNND